MLEAPHVLVGIAIAEKTGHPLLAIPMALGSHFLLDMIPHWNPHLNREMRNGGLTKLTKFVILADGISSFAVTAFFVRSALPDSTLALTIALSAIASVLPDLIEAPYFLFKVKTRFIERSILFQKAIQTDAGLILGIATQVIVVAVAIFWIFS